MLHHAWSLEVFQDDDGLKVVQHKGGFTILQGVRTFVRQFIYNCREFHLGLLQDSKAIFRCRLMFVNQQPMPMREKYQMYLQIILQQTERELQFFIIYIGTNLCWVISFFACLERMRCEVPTKRLKFRHFSWSASSSCLRLVWTAWKCRNLSDEVQGFKYVH